VALRCVRTRVRVPFGLCSCDSAFGMVWCVFGLQEGLLLSSWCRVTCAWWCAELACRCSALAVLLACMSLQCCCSCARRVWGTLESTCVWRFGGAPVLTCASQQGGSLLHTARTQHVQAVCGWCEFERIRPSLSSCGEVKPNQSLYCLGDAFVHRRVEVCRWVMCMCGWLERTLWPGCSSRIQLQHSLGGQQFATVAEEILC
jgi:hypothetical protein